jgi:hypothetical protein
MEIAWPVNRVLARRMMEQPENQSALEAALGRLFGQPLRVIHTEAPSDATEQPKASDPSLVPTQPVEYTSPVMRESNPFGKDATSDEEAMPMDPPAIAQPTDTRNALEKAQAFLEVQDETHRRVKLLMEMLKGKMIDECGEPLPLDQANPA